MELLIQYTLLYASVLILVALGGCFSEHSGVINLGLEGIMVIGALGGALTMSVIQKSFPDASAFSVIISVVLVAVIFGIIYSLLLAVACVNFNADQTIIGTALNILGVALATVIVKAINTAADPNNVSSVVEYINAKKAFIINAGGMQLNWFMIITALILVAAYITLYKTRLGLRLMAFGGLGGIVYITAGVSEWKFEYGVAGFGFLALAVMIFGQWKPTRIALAALLFGFFRALSNVYTGFSFMVALNLPSGVYNMMPYVISLLVLAFTSKKSRAPKAEGIPYDKGQR